MTEDIVIHPQPFYSVTELARIARRDRKTVYAILKDGGVELTPIRNGRKKVVMMQSLKEKMPLLWAGIMMSIVGVRLSELSSVETGKTVEDC